VPGLSAHVGSAILRSLDNSPGNRPASCLQFIAELGGKSAAPPARAPRLAPPAADGKRARPRGRDQRATVRHASTKGGSCRPISPGEATWAAKVQDVSAGGVGLVLERRFEPATVLLVEVLPTAKEPGRQLLVKVVRAQQLSPRRWLLGCVFARRLSDEDVQTVV
jgi:hypothetical protein